MEILEHDHISLRALEPEDLEILYLWENDPSVWPLSGTLVPYSRYVLKQYLQNAGKDIFEQKQLRLIIELREEKRPVGAIDLFDFDPFHRRAGVGVLIAGGEDRMKGYAGEALETLKRYCFEVLGLHQLWCNITAGNHPSIRLFQSAGFTLAGEKKEWLFNGSGFESELLFQCIKDKISV
ncbi:MAG: GNAT family protein [Bacteroidales bacterium]